MHEPPVPDERAIRDCWLALVRPGDVHELRIPRPRDKRNGNVAGYFNDPGAFAKVAASFAPGWAEGVYVTLNPVNPDLFARATNRVERNARTSAKDTDIIHYRNLLIDIDPVRPAGISATNAERQHALDTVEEVVAFLTEQGWPPAVVQGSSGNGGMLVYRLEDLPSTADNTALIKQILESLAHLFDRDAVKIDTVVSNPARLVKIVGTIAAKGDYTADRPWRRAEAVIRGY